MRTLIIGVLCGFIGAALAWHLHRVSPCDIDHMIFHHPATRANLLIVCGTELRGGNAPVSLLAYLGPFVDLSVRPLNKQLTDKQQQAGL